MKLTLTILAVISMLSNLNAQNEVVKAIPRDTSFTVFQSYQKIKNDYPQVTPVVPVLPKGVRAGKPILFMPTCQTHPLGNVICILIYSGLKKKENTRLLSLFLARGLALRK